MKEGNKTKFLIWLKRRKRLLIGIATILLLIFMIYFINFQSLVEKIIAVGVVGLLIFIATYTVAFILRAFKLKLIFKGIDKEVAYSTSLFSIGAAFVINDLTPAKLGDLAKIFIIKDKENIRLSESTAAIAIERVLDLILLFSISCFALIYLYLTSFGEASERLILGQTIQFYIIIGAIFIIAIFILFLLLIYRTNTILKIIRKFSKKLAYYLERFILNFKKGMKNFKNHKKELIYIILLGFPTWIIDAAIITIIAYPLGYEFNIFLLILAKILTFFSKTFPITPGGWGISENVGALFISFFYASSSILYTDILSIFFIDHLFRSAYLLIFGGYSILHYNISLKAIKEMKKATIKTKITKYSIQMPKIHSISVVVPAYNEEKNLRKSINVIYNYLKNIIDKFEILIVENGSTDKTAIIAKDLESKFSNVKTFSLDVPSFGGAYRYGILQSQNDMVTLYPVDLAFSLDFIGRAFKLISKYPIVLGVRFHQKSEVDRPLIRTLISRFHTMLVNAFFRTQYNDVDCLKAFQTNIGKKLVKYTSADGPFIEVEFMYLLKKSGLSYLEIPINHIEKEFARHPYYIIQSIVKNLVQLIAYKLKTI